MSVFNNSNGISSGVLVFRSDSFVALFFSLICISLSLVLMFPDGFVSGNSSYWLSENSDITQYVAGFNAYFDAPWSWPLLSFDTFNYPYGTRATFVDIIPIYSVILKVLVPESYFPFNPFGYWVFFCYLMQGVGAWWILRELKINSLIALVALTVFFVFSPALMARMGHISLMSHWLLLFSFCLYVRSTKLGELQFKSAMLLLLCAFYINVYLFVMSFCIYIAAVSHLWKSYNLKQNIIFVVSPALMVLSSMLITLLPFSSSGVVGDGGFGLYSMNILSPFLGGDLFRINAVTMPGQGEGFNYLGAGLLALLPLAITLDMGNNFGCLRKHKFMFFLVFLFTAYALSNKVYFGTYNIINVPYPSFMDSITSQFRASGRFFWPVGYAIAIYSIVVISRYCTSTSTSTRKRYFGLGIILIFTAIHIVDLKGRLNVFSSVVSQNSTSILTPSKVELATGEGVSMIYFYPKFRCPTKSSPHNTLLPLMKYASERDIKLNTGYIARYQASCSDVEEEISLAINESSAFVFASDDYPNVTSIQGLFPKDVKIICKLEPGMYICRVNK
ncbi:MULTISPECIES: DUF6311 domain-containing protein [unclassified Vibrio]|uniref:DUF6311 domain-containing protein n=1 Tax=unclassified Vibrio TaxID=2614977 RepID=UPI00352BD2E8